MNNTISKEKFLSSISEYDNAYQKFYNNHIPVFKEFYVESVDDAEFYGYFLAKIYQIPKLLKCYGCNGKKEVLKEYSRYNGKKAGFIVDLDYIPIDNKYDKVIVTSGYSMENFFFYEKNNKFNFEFIFDQIYKDPIESKIKIIDFTKKIIEFKEKYVYYYAYFKTSMEMFYKSHNNNSHINIKNKMYSCEDIEKLIMLEISSLNSFIKNKFIEKYNKNLKMIREAGFMLIRGHDIFNILLDYLRNDFPSLKGISLLKLVHQMLIPDDFYMQFIK